LNVLSEILVVVEFLVDKVGVVERNHYKVDDQIKIDGAQDGEEFALGEPLRVGGPADGAGEADEEVGQVQDGRPTAPGQGQSHDRQQNRCKAQINVNIIKLVN